MARVRENFQSGFLTDDPLTETATVLNSAEFAGLREVVAPDILAMTLDPEGIDGPPEIVWVTDHVEASTSVEVVRGQELASGGNPAREHLLGVVWEHRATAEDFGTLTHPHDGTAESGGLISYEDLGDLPDVDGAVGEPSLRTLGVGPLQAAPGDHGHPLGLNFKRARVFETGATSYVPSGDATKALMKAVGDGGAGGGSPTGADTGVGSGGGGGAYGEVFLPSLASSYTLAIGTGGAGVLADNGGSGTGVRVTDDDTSTDVLFVPGGTGGVAPAKSALLGDMRQGGLGGQASSGIGDLLIDGESGGPSIVFSSSHGSGGRGGQAARGGGGGRESIIQTNGETGRLYGGGGAGSNSEGGTSSRTGGDGGDGVLVVYEYGP